MLAFKLETWEEAKVIFIFHVVGTAMEMFKTSVGSWIYPEAVAAAHRRRAAVHRLHVCRHRLLHRALLAPVRFPLHASSAAMGAVLLAVGIYVNFFAHHYVRGRAPACCSR